MNLPRNFPETKSALAHWYMAVKKGDFSNIAELRSVFPTADRVGNLRCLTLEKAEFA